MSPAERAAAILAEVGARDHRQPRRLHLGAPRQRLREQGRGLPAHRARRRSSAACWPTARAPLRPEVVCGPALGGIILSQWTAHHLGALAVYAEKLPAGGLALRRGYDRLVAGRRVLVVEDVLNTGGSVRDAVSAPCARPAARWSAVAALCNRGGVTAADLDVPALRVAARAVARLLGGRRRVRSAATAVPVNTDVGKGREFLASRA